MRKLFLNCFFVILLLPDVIGQAHAMMTDEKQPLILLDSFHTSVNGMIINVNNLESISVLTDSLSLQPYGKSGMYGVVLMVSKKSTRYVRIDALLDQFQIAEKDRNLRVCIKKVLIDHPDLIIADPDEVTGIEITTERRTMNLESAESTEKFINIMIKDAGI